MEGFEGREPEVEKGLDKEAQLLPPLSTGLRLHAQPCPEDSPVYRMDKAKVGTGIKQFPWTEGEGGKEEPRHVQIYDSFLPFIIYQGACEKRRVKKWGTPPNLTLLQACSLREQVFFSQYLCMLECVKCHANTRGPTSTRGSGAFRAVRRGAPLPSTSR